MMFFLHCKPHFISAYILYSACINSASRFELFDKEHPQNASSLFRGTLLCWDLVALLDSMLGTSALLLSLRVVICCCFHVSLNY